MSVLAPATKCSSDNARTRFLALFFMVSLPLLQTVGLTDVRAQGGATRVETFQVRGDAQLRVENLRGTVRIEVWDQDSIRVIAEKRTPANKALSAQELVLMSAQNVVYAQCKTDDPATRIDFAINVPRRLHLQITGGAGSVEVNGPLASAVIETASGNILYRVPANDNARIVMRSERGLVTSTAPITVSERVGSRSLQGRLGSGTSPIILNSRSGNITLSRAAASSYVAAAFDRPSITAPGDRRQDVSQSPPVNTGITSRDAALPGQRKGSDPEDEFGDPFGEKDRPVLSNRAPKTYNDPRDTRGNAGNSRSSGGMVIFSQDSRSSDSSMHEQIGPISRPREERLESAGSSGMRVRIIPADQPLGAEQDDQTYKQNDRGVGRDNTSTVPRNTGKNPNVGPSGSDRPVYGNGSWQRRDEMPARSDSQPSRPAQVDEEARDVIAANPPVRSGPPILKRKSDSEVGTEAEPAESRPSSPEAEEAIKLETAVVNLNVSVTNRSGVALQNLKKEDFQVSEDGVPQPVDFFQASTAPFNLVLVLDLSGSIEDKLDVIKSAALKFLDVIGSKDRVAVLTFTDEVRVVSELSSDRGLVKNRIKTIDAAAGGTKFYEAMWYALNGTLRGTEGQRNAIVVLTDGVDSSLDRNYPEPTRISFTQLARKLEESDVMVFPIYLDTEFDELFRGRSSAEAFEMARGQLRQIADVTGGELYKAERASDLNGVYKEVAGALRTVYSVGYYSTNQQRDGRFRRIRVGVSRPDAAVRTKKGYYAK